MGILWDIQSKLKESVVWIVLFAIPAYFAIYAINGERGLPKYFYLKKEIADAQKISAEYARQKLLLDEKVKHLSNSSLDLDLLEERARIVLNLADSEEFIILDEE
ncbi:MAG: septum formation initiator family protein [Alphaproteobacteria bacterium]|nr:septum formation initiator family protein [Alphaproteobacteria bacterium]